MSLLIAVQNEVDDILDTMDAHLAEKTFLGRLGLPLHNLQFVMIITIININATSFCNDGPVTMFRSENG